MTEAPLTFLGRAHPGLFQEEPSRLSAQALCQTQVSAGKSGLARTWLTGFVGQSGVGVGSVACYSSLDPSSDGATR